MQTTEAAIQTVIITGGNAGLGYACAEALAAAHSDWQIVLACRNTAAGMAAAQAISAATSNQHISTIALDLASLASVRACAAELAGRDLPPLRGLVCNAGIQIVSGTTYTADGFETTFGVNHLGHFLLVNLLREQMVAPARIAFVSSGTHDPNEPIAKLIGGYAPRFRFPDEMAYPQLSPDPAEQRESPTLAGRHRYGTSKLCNLFCTYELAQRLASEQPGITVNAFDPGLMPGTGLARDADRLTRFAWNRVLPLLSGRIPGINSVRVSGANLARLIDNPALATVSGSYFAGRAVIRSSAESYDTTKARLLWERSAALVDGTG